MQYIRPEADGQLTFAESTDFLMIPCCLYGFHNTETTVHEAVSGRKVFCYHGTLDVPPEETVCPECGARMHVNQHPEITLRHLCIGGNLSSVVFPHNQFRCPECGGTHSQFISFKADGHRITEELYQYTRDLLAHGTYTLKQVSEITGLGKNVVKAIDKKRLQDAYTIDGKKLRKPEHKAKFLGIDEFKLHNGHRYATHIIDMERGHVLWIGHGKKKQVVYDFIDHVGMEWMESVEAVACDMNSDFQEAFEEKCPWIQPVYDYFHIVKNFNDKVVSEVRKDEQRRLLEEGLADEAKALKKTRYILMSSRKTLQEKDEQAKTGEPITRPTSIFPREEYIRKVGYEAKYDELLSQNRLLFTLDLIKERLALAYARTDEVKMADDISWIMDVCASSVNSHLKWFGRLLDSHFEGIIAHATYRISSGKMEGINNKIKVLRRQAYGLPDDDYFFLRLFDASRKGYIRNPPSHKICD